MKNIIVLLLVSASIGFAQLSFVSTNVNGYNVILTGGKDTTKTTNTLYSAIVSGAALNGRKIVAGFQVTDTAAAGTESILPTVTCYIQGSYDGTNFTNLGSAIITADPFYQSTWATPGMGTADLSSYTLPWYRLSMVPSATLGTASTTVAKTCGQFKWFIAGLK